MVQILNNEAKTKYFFLLLKVVLDVRKKIRHYCNSYYAITLETESRDGYKIMTLTQKNAGDGSWHKVIVKYEKESKLLEGFVDNNLIESKVVSMSTTSGFYFGGEGGCGEFSMYLRNFKFVLDLNMKLNDFISMIN